MEQEFYIGQIFEGSYPPEAAIWCNANNAYIEVIGDHVYEIKEVPAPLPPTHDEVAQARAAAYASLVDPLHSRKMRKTILDEWFEEEEAEYIEEVKELSAKIAELHPYPEDMIEKPAEVEESATDDIEEVASEEPEAEEEPKEEEDV